MFGFIYTWLRKEKGIGDFFMANNVKARYWVAVAYPENMIDDWKVTIGDVLGLPGAYCVHDKDMLGKHKGKEDHERKEHVHIMLAFPNTTTYKRAMEVFSSLNAPGKQALNKVQVINSVRNMYDYLIHDTETCKKQGKYKYDKAERIEFNNFDIGAYEQLSIDDKNKMTKELCDFIKERKISNFLDFYDMAMKEYDFSYFEIIKTYSGFFERLCKGNYHKISRMER